MYSFPPVVQNSLFNTVMIDLNSLRPKGGEPKNVFLYFFFFLDYMKSTTRHQQH